MKTLTICQHEEPHSLLAEECGILKVYEIPPGGHYACTTMSLCYI